MAALYVCIDCDRYQPADAKVTQACVHCGGWFVVRERDPDEPPPHMVFRPDDGDLRDNRNFLKRYTF